MKLTLVTLSLLTTALSLPSTSREVSFPITDLETTDLTAEEYFLTLASPLAKRQYSSSTYNQLTDGTPCRPVTLIYARGTSQQGNVGDSAAVGPLFFNNLARLVGGTSQLAIQGVTYSASVAGFLAGGDATGSTTMANLISTAATKCPSTKIVLSGYSQGAQLVHNAAQKTSAANAAKVAAVVVFGDPKRGQTFGSISTSKTLTVCHTGDNICEGGSTITAAHLNYQRDAPAAAQFVAGKV
ncbi:carbohydrate esterase family 5 protein [Dothidotthia symphoricarpi CBS 119687]|uniref:Cutinase n=1 Tax=Dothidotthia symphoricarpi CBS 119687 TaxID=1392245 RepID=A0A6A5ZXY8_9PLEO|nr:carbohydrate esterase family 5 protein [Dothidotthia symphoricarpi CBS 119687]KAF2124450.1 carbohydrate esterase family 5 protein [Dothidotthia symphoricarpi CBS 119687]